MIRKTFLACTITIIIASLAGCSEEHKITGTKGKVVSIINGNTLRLHDGLTVELLGVKPSDLGKDYMEKHIIDKNVTLVADKKDPKQTYKTKSTKVRAYVKIAGETGSLNGKLLIERWANGVNNNHLRDSSKVFNDYWNGKGARVLLTDAELQLKMKPATFIIRTDKGSGTGFFINDNGLALTNNHVLNYENSQAAVMFFGKDGTLDMNNYRSINRIIYSFREGKVDFTIFQVELGGNEKVPYLKLCEKRASDGERIAKIGCPAGTVCNFQTGNLSNYNEGYFFTHSISSNHGDSGGPVANFYGEILGINQSIEFNETLSNMSGSLQKAEGIAYAVDAMLIREILDNNGIKYGK